nr:MAG TPA: hypothetical protein [Caudoviricetes sp.]
MMQSRGAHLRPWVYEQKERIKVCHLRYRRGREILARRNGIC